MVSASFFETYSGEVFDLLVNKAKLRILDIGKQQVKFVGLTEKVVGSVDELLNLREHGNTARTERSHKTQILFGLVQCSSVWNRLQSGEMASNISMTSFHTSI
jgi:hypothetical protein